MSKHLIIVGNLGAGAHLGKNICLLVKQFHLKFSQTNDWEWGEK